MYFLLLSLQVGPDSVRLCWAQLGLDGPQRPSYFGSINWVLLLHGGRENLKSEQNNSDTTKVCLEQLLSPIFCHQASHVSKTKVNRVCNSWRAQVT